MICKLANASSYFPGTYSTISKLTIAEGVTTINAAFSTFKGLETINIPSTVTNINSGAFANHSNLREVNIYCGSNTLLSVDMNIANNAFASCPEAYLIFHGESVVEADVNAMVNKPWGLPESHISIENVIS